MTEPAEHRPLFGAYGATLEKSVVEILASAQPLPSGDEMVIEDLTEEEERLFFEAIRDA